MTSETRTCQNCKNEFVVEPEDFNFYKKIDVPPPTLCSECRYRRRLMDRNEWSLHKRKCDFTGETIVSIYRSDSPFPVYKPEVWRSDVWDPMSYGREFDFSRPFFEQYEKLRRAVPHLALVAFDSVNSEYSNQSQHNKDCYMVSATGSSEKCMYGNWYQAGCFFSADCCMLGKSELCYEAMNCWQSSSLRWCQDCVDCVDLSFSTDCHGCTHCFGCVGLRNKSYMWFNTQLTKNDYEKRFREFDWSREGVKQAMNQAWDLFSSSLHKYYRGVKAFSSSGDYMSNVQNSRLNFNCIENKDTAYLQDAGETVDSLDVTEVLTVERSYELQGCATINRSMVLRSSWVMTDSYYCDMSFSCSNCFGCFGVRQKEYCILNKQYLKEDYLKLREKIIAHMKATGEWGEYFPPEVSPFAYNESVAQIYFPLTKKEAAARGYPWYDKEDSSQQYIPTLTPEKIPERISETPATITSEVIACATQISDGERERRPECTKVFRVIPMELDLYRKLNIPIPAKCFPCRRTDRFNSRNPRRLWPRTCGCSGVAASNSGYQNHAAHFHGENPCPNKFETSYAPDRPEIVYCEQCYNAEVA